MHCFVWWECYGANCSLVELLITGPSLQECCVWRGREGKGQEVRGWREGGCGRGEGGGKEDGGGGGGGED
jgi:hypothetical protein